MQGEAMAVSVLAIVHAPGAPHVLHEDVGDGLERSPVEVRMVRLLLWRPEPGPHPHHPRSVLLPLRRRFGVY